MFRQEALDRLSSPEELDKLMHITSPRLWLALLAIVGLLVAGVFWSVFTSIPTTISVQGALAGGGTQGAVQPVVFATLQEGGEIQAGEGARVSVHNGAGHGTRILDASVASVDPYPVDQTAMLKILGSPGYAQTLAAQQKIIEVRLNLGPQNGAAGGNRPKSGGPRTFKLARGMIVSAVITVDHQSPIHLIIP